MTRGGGPGVELAAPSGTVVRSVAAGRVAFADRQDEYGLTVILDHGDRYFSLYGDLGSVDVHVGDTVAAGARIGTVGSLGIGERAATSTSRSARTPSRSTRAPGSGSDAR